MIYCSAFFITNHIIKVSAVMWVDLFVESVCDGMLKQLFRRGCVEDGNEAVITFLELKVYVSGHSSYHTK